MTATCVCNSAGAGGDAQAAWPQTRQPGQRWRGQHTDAVCGNRRSATGARWYSRKRKL